MSESLRVWAKATADRLWKHDVNCEEKPCDCLHGAILAALCEAAQRERWACFELCGECATQAECADAACARAREIKGAIMARGQMLSQSEVAARAADARRAAVLSNLAKAIGKETP